MPSAAAAARRRRQEAATAKKIRVFRLRCRRPVTLPLRPPHPRHCYVLRAYTGMRLLPIACTASFQLFAISMTLYNARPRQLRRILLSDCMKFLISICKVFLFKRVTELSTRFQVQVY